MDCCKHTTILGATLVTIYLLLASPVGAMKVSTFTLAGIRLGMTSDQVYKALASRSTDYTGRPEPPRVRHSLCFAEPQPELNGGSCVSQIGAYIATTEIRVDFIEDFPAHLRRMQVSSIRSFGIVSDATPKAATIFRKAVFARYGPPTITVGPNYVWCSGGSIKHCRADQPPNYDNTSDHSPLPAQTLELSSGSNLTLSDHAYSISRLKAMQHALSLQTKPGS